MISDRIVKGLLLIALLVVMLAGQLIAVRWAVASTGLQGDLAVEIAKRSRDRVENSGQMLKASSRQLFAEFAKRTGELQTLLDTRERLEKAGMLSKDDPAGKARRAHINARILLEVGKLKDACDNNLDGLLASLDAFDRAIADSIVDTQATRSINANYELTLNSFKLKEKKRFLEAAATAEDLLKQIQSTSDETEKRRLVSKYNRVKKRLNRIRQRRILYEARLKVASMNQQISGVVREKIRTQGSEVPSRFRAVMSSLYAAFAKVVPVAETGGTGSVDVLADFGFGSIREFSESLEIVDASTRKLSGVLDRMVNDVMDGLGEIKVVDDTNVTSRTLSVEKEIEAISRERAAWDNG